MNPGTALQDHTSEFMGFPRSQSVSPWLRDSWEVRNFQARRAFCSCGQRAVAARRLSSQVSGGCGPGGTHCWGRHAQKGSKDRLWGWAELCLPSLFRLNSDLLVRREGRGSNISEGIKQIPVQDGKIQEGSQENKYPEEA